ECIHGDVRDSAHCTRALQEIDCVYHFAARTGGGQSMYDISDYVSTNVVGTAALIEATLKTGAALKRFVLSSSRAVYGEGLFHCQVHGIVHPSPRDPHAMRSGDFAMHCPHCNKTMTALPTPENCPLEPLSVYAVSKKQQE